MSLSSTTQCSESDINIKLTMSVVEFLLFCFIGWISIAIASGLVLLFYYFCEQPQSKIEQHKTRESQDNVIPNIEQIQTVESIETKTITGSDLESDDVLPQDTPVAEDLAPSEPIIPNVDTQRQDKELEAAESIKASISRLIDSSSYLEAELLYIEHEEQLRLCLDHKRDAVFASQIDKMLLRCAQTNQTLHDIQSDESEEWTFGMSLFGITTHYKTNNDNKLIVRMSGVLENTPVLDSAACLYEVDLFKKWIPCCSNAALVDRLGAAEVLAYLAVSVAAVSRDTLLHVYASDCLKSHGKILLIGKSVNDWEPPPGFAQQKMYTKDLGRSSSSSSSSANAPTKSPGAPKPVPWIPKGWFHDKMDVFGLKTVFEILDEKSVKVRIRLGRHLQPSAHFICPPNDILLAALL